MRRLVILVAFIPVLSGFSSESFDPNDELNAGKVSTARWIDEEAMDRTVAPTDDFYEFVNGGWLKQTEIPESLPWISPFVRNYFINRERLETIITGLASGQSEVSSDEERIANLYISFMDTASIEAQGLQPIEPVLQEIDEVRSLDDLAIIFAEINRKHFRPGGVRQKYAAPFVVVARPDDHDSMRVSATLRPAGLGMYTREAYINDEEQPRATYRTHIEKMLRLSGAADAGSQADKVLNLEVSLAEARLSLTAGMSHQDNYRRMDLDELGEMTPNFDWALYLERSGVGVDHDFVVKDSGYFRSLANIFADTPLSTWRAYLRWQVLRVYAPYLGTALVDESFSYYGQVELGRSEPMERQKQAIIFVEQGFPDLLGCLYAEKYVPAEIKSRVIDMVKEIQHQYAESIRNLEWMSESTRKEALDKLDKMIIKVAYPDEWRTYDGPDMAPDRLVANVMALNETYYNAEIERIGKKVDRTRWLGPVYSNSAWYYRSTNELTIPAGYLLPPWFDIKAEPALNYGGIGTVIGHEMGHAFDQQGSQYDGDANLRNWWTPGDQKRFSERIRRLVAQFNDYSPAPGKHVDGELTLGENIGDLVGVTMAYRAFMANSVDATISDDTGFSPEQRFFISYAMHWRAKYSEQLLDRILKGDEHAPQRYRANGPLRNFTPFYEAFGVEKGDEMYLSPEQRVSIW